MGFFFSKLRNYFIGLQQDLNFIVFSLFFLAIALFSWHCYSLYLVNSLSTKKIIVKLVKIIAPLSGVRIRPNYIIACRTGVFFLLLLFSRFKLARANAKQAWSARSLARSLE